MSTNIRIIPTIGLTGLYKLSSKLDNFYNKTTPYTCKAIRRFDDIVNAGEDIYYDYYEPLGLPETDMELDVVNNECIVALTTADNKWIYIPSSTIIEVPDQSGIKYTPLGLFATLGAIDDTYDLTGLIAKVNDIIAKYLGHTPEIKIAVIGNTEMVSSAQHASIVSARSAGASNNTGGGAAAEPAELMADISSLQTKVSMLEAYIISILPIVNASTTAPSTPPASTSP